METKEKSAIAILILLAIFAGFFFYYDSKLDKIEKGKQIKEEQKLSEMKNKIEALSLEAKEISIYDIDKAKEIYGKNSDKRVPLASLVKTMTVIVALEENLPYQNIKISGSALNQEGDNGLILNEVWKLSDLAKLTLLSSSNDGAKALSENTSNFVSMMNQKAKKLGLSSMVFYNSTGLDLDLQHAGAYGSAYDVNKMAMYALLLKPEIFNATTLSEITLKSLSGISHKVKNRDEALSKLPNVLFSKTGNTDLAGGNLTIIFKNKDGYKIAVTVLGSSINGRFSDMEKIISVL